MNSIESSTRTSKWAWSVCGMLLLATTLNYMDRIALNQASKRIMVELKFDEKGYGTLESRFGLAFALGALISGWLVDRFGPRIMYPIMVTLWSAAGAATVFVREFDELLWCRIALGFFEAANWPCALRTTQAILSKEKRSAGNGILQSGTALGSILTPAVLYLSLNYVDTWSYGGWRLPFWLVGVLGVGWSIAWFVLVRPRDLDTPATAEQTAHDTSRWGVLSLFRDPRMWALCFLVVAVNSTWHFFRAWTPLFLQDGHGYRENAVFRFSMLYYAAADIGALSCGFLTLSVVRRGVSVHRSRMIVFFLFACLALLSVPIGLLDRGPLLMTLLVVLGFASLGVFPNYYAFTQELTTKHQGKVSGALGFVNWVAMFFLQDGVGRYVKNSIGANAVGVVMGGAVKASGSLQESYQSTYGWAVAIAGFGPILGFLVMLLLFRSTMNPTDKKAPARPSPKESTFSC